LNNEKRKWAEACREDEWLRLRGGLGRTASRIAAGLPVRVGFLGGSVTAGAGAADPERDSWRALCAKELSGRVRPGGSFAFRHAAIGGTDSTYGAFRLEAHLLRSFVPDLLFVEFSVNDAGDRTASVRGMEGIVRRTLRGNPAADICFVYTARKGEDAFDRPRPAIRHHEEVADRYGLPSVNIAAVANRLLAGGSLRWEELSGDDVHPNNEGYRLYADIVGAGLDVALARGGEASGPRAMPEPLDPVAYEGGKLASPEEARDRVGFRMERGWRPDAVCNWDPPADVLAAEEPGAELRFDFAGTAVGLDAIAGMDAGAIEYAIDDGPWRTLDTFDDYCRLFHRPKPIVLADGLPPGTHRLRVRLSADAHPDSAGRALRIRGFLVNASREA